MFLCVATGMPLLCLGASEFGFEYFALDAFAWSGNEEDWVGLWEA